jgi:hypothetical protein
MMLSDAAERCPRAFTRRTQKPLSSLWKVTRSIRPEISSGLRSGIAAFISLGIHFPMDGLPCVIHQEADFEGIWAAPMGFGSARAFQK